MATFVPFRHLDTILVTDLTNPDIQLTMYNFNDSQLLCILTSFWVLHAPKSWSNYFVDFRREITEKGLKCAEKVENGSKISLTSFWVHAAPKSWSKYTTGYHIGSDVMEYCYSLLILGPLNKKLLT